MDLAAIRAAIRTEAGYSPQQATGSASNDNLTALVNTTIKKLVVLYELPEMHVEYDLSLVAGTRTYDFPTGIGLNQTMEVWCEFGSDWIPVSYGIGRYQQSVYTATEQSWPVQFWEWRQDLAQLVVWPTPSQAGTLKFSGVREPADLVNDSDTPVIDGMLIALYAAYLLLRRAGAEDAESKAGEFERYRQALLARQMGTATPANLAGGRSVSRGRPYLDYTPSGDL